MAGTYTIACKVATGLILENRNADGLVIGRVVVNGPARAVGVDWPVEIVGGYGLTHNVDADFFDKWLADNKANRLVTGGFVFAHKQAASVASEAREKVGIKSGMEPIDPNNLPKIEQPGVPGAQLMDFRTAPESAKPLAA